MKKLAPKFFAQPGQSQASFGRMQFVELVYDEGEQVMAKMRTCSHCGNEFPATSDFFYRHKNTSDGWHSWCKPCCREGNKRSLAKRYSTFEGRISTFLLSCKTSAKKRGQEFSLTRNDFLQMWDAQGGLCVYTGMQMELQPNTLLSVSVERVDSSIGYTASNTVLCCNVVNRMKSNLDGQTFFDMCKAVTLWMSDESLNLDVEFVKDAY